MAKEKIGLGSIIGGIVVVYLLIDYASKNPEVIDDVQYMVSELCGIDDKLANIANNIDQDFIDNLENENHKRISNLLRSGEEVPKCDLWEFYNALDEEKRKKIHWAEFTCNINDCIER